MTYMKDCLVLLLIRCLPQRNDNMTEREQAMEYFTLAVLLYYMNGHPQEAKIWFASEEDCWSVIMNNDTLYDQINAHGAWCEVSHIPSKMVKPKLRPW